MLNQIQIQSQLSNRLYLFQNYQYTKRGKHDRQFGCQYFFLDVRLQVGQVEDSNSNHLLVEPKPIFFHHLNRCLRLNQSVIF